MSMFPLEHNPAKDITWWGITEGFTLCDSAGIKRKPGSSAGISPHLLRTSPYSYKGTCRKELDKFAHRYFGKFRGTNPILVDCGYAKKGKKESKKHKFRRFVVFVHEGHVSMYEYAHPRADADRITKRLRTLFVVLPDDLRHIMYQFMGVDMLCRETFHAVLQQIRALPPKITLVITLPNEGIFIAARTFAYSYGDQVTKRSNYGCYSRNTITRYISHTEFVSCLRSGLNMQLERELEELREYNDDYDSDW